MRRILRWFLYALGLFLLIVIGALAALQTGPGKRLLAAQLSSLLSTPESGFEIAGIEGWVPLDMRIGSLQLSDRDGVWLNTSGVGLDWSPSALFGGRIHVDDIGAERVELIRTPIGEDDAPEPASDEPFRLPELPKSLPPITLERLAIPDISLAEAFLGEAASFGLEGSVQASDGGDVVTAKLNLDRTDEATASIKLEAKAGLDPRTLDLALDAAESGGLIAALGNRPEMGDVDISLTGNGPLEDWAGRLRADADGLALVEMDLGLALVDQPRLTVEGALQPASGVLPDDIASLIGEQLSIDLDVVQTRAQALELQKAVIGAGFATLDAMGSVAFDEGDLALQSRLAVPDLEPLGTIATAALSGEAEALLSMGGTLDSPEGTLDLQVTEPAFDGNAATSVETKLRLTSTAPLSSDLPTFHVAMEGQALGLSVPGATLPDPDIGWRAQIEAPLEGQIKLEDVAIETAGSALTASGAIDPAKLEGTIDLALDAPSLQRLAGPYGQPVDGKALIKAAIGLANQAKDITVDLDGGLDGLEGLPPGVAELLGQRTSLKAQATLDPENTLNLGKLSVAGANMSLEGEASLNLDQKDLDARFAADLPDLAVLDGLIPDSAAGALRFEADLGGDLDAPTADLRLTSRDLVIAGEPLAALDVSTEARDLIAAPNGNLKIDVEARGIPATLSLDYRLAEGALDLDAINLKAPETEVSGALTLALETSLIDGALQGKIAKLGAFEQLVGQPLDGSIDLSATLTPEGERQNAALTLRGRDIDGDFGRLRTLDVDARVTDAAAEPAIDAKASLTGFEQGENVIDALTINASGNGDDLNFQLDLAGEVVKPLELSTGGALALKEGLALNLDTLNGAFAGEPLRLGRPLSLTQSEKGLELAELDLRLGEASLKGNVAIGEQTANGRITLRSLPLSWSETFGGPALSGEARADIDLNGNLIDPTVTASLDVEGVLGEDVASGDVPLDMSLNARLDEGQLDADLVASRLTRKPITATASLPIQLTLQPFAFDMPENGEIDGRIDAEILLARLADFLALDDQILKGTLTADIDIDGTIGEPKIQGPVRLEGGGYENGATGTDIRDLVLTALASNERIEITELAGKTGTKRGTIASNGWLQLDAEADFPLSLSLNLDEARLVNRDDIDTRISGDIAMTGNLAGASIEGDLTVDRAEISIPEGGGPNLPEIEVVEVGGNIVNPPIEEEEDVEEEKPFDPALDVRIRLPRKIYVRGRGLESEWEGDLQLSGRASDPIIVGSLNIKKGHFDFLDKRFELALGEITFSGSTPPNPIITLEARAEDDDFTAIIKLNGPADDPQLLLSSEPELPEDEVLARLLFNRELSQIGPVEAGKLALAVNRLRGGGGFDAFGEIRNILRIDTLDVVSDEEGETAVRAGKYLSDEVYVEVEDGGQAGGSARVEIELLPNIALEAETSENADSGVGIKWKFDY